MCRFIAAIATAHYGVTELVCGQTLAIRALERVRGTGTFLGRLAVGLVFAGRTVHDAVATSRLGYAAAGRAACIRLAGALVARTLFVRAVRTVFAAVAHKEPTDAGASAATLKPGDM